MGEAVFISICIPAYNRPAKLKRLLDSIQAQSYRHFEVVITDDSPENEVNDLVHHHPLMPSIRYFKNHPVLGTPENWNEGIRRAGGDWIKLMHDDDWFRDAQALQVFADGVKKHPDGNFFFSGYRNVFEGKNKTQEMSLSRPWERLLNSNPENLLSKNVIGPPSVVLHKKIPELLYDRNLKWLVDIDFYIRFIRSHPMPVFLPEQLIEVGISEDQVTQSCFRNPLVEIPEHLYLLNKMGTRALKNIILYDAYWRFIRNLNLRSTAEIRNAGYAEPVPRIIRSMIGFQAFFPAAVLKTGIISKGLMALHFIFQYPKLARG
ncbi:MAG TPA: glycosyltransferase [Puia sp.]|jgi:glycosyltransferase involved in cell wall biosynthesis